MPEDVNHDSLKCKAQKEELIRDRLLMKTVTFFDPSIMNKQKMMIQYKTKSRLLF